MKQIIYVLTALALLAGCGNKEQKIALDNQNFKYIVEKFADLQILRYRVNGFEELSLQQKELVYYLTEAALWGRDIFYDQNGKYNLRISRALEAIYTGYKGDRDNAEFKALEVYLKRVWFSSGIHHHYGSEKFVPEFSEDFFRKAIATVDANNLPLADGGTAVRRDLSCNLQS